MDWKVLGDAKDEAVAGRISGALLLFKRADIDSLVGFGLLLLVLTICDWHAAPLSFGILSLGIGALERPRSDEFMIGALDRPKRSDILVV